MGACCSSSHIQDDDYELAARNGVAAPYTNHSDAAATHGSSLPPRPIFSVPTTHESTTLSTAAATEESGNRLSTSQRPATSSSQRPATSSSNHAHLSDWDWQRDDSDERSSDSPPPRPVPQVDGRPRARVESTATTRQLRLALQKALTSQSAARDYLDHPRGRTQDIQFGNRPPREHAPGRPAATQHALGEESTVPWPSGRDAR